MPLVLVSNVSMHHVCFMLDKVLVAPIGKPNVAAAAPYGSFRAGRVGDLARFAPAFSQFLGWRTGPEQECQAARAGTSCRYLQCA
jgi:hypothetical protein